jgi:Protein of unknown function (DUF616)
MADVAVLTACYAGFDTIRPQAKQDCGVDWVCSTDDPGLEAPPPWQVVVEPSSEHPCLAAKRPKMLPWSLVPHERVIWVDASMQVTAPGFAREALDCIHDGIALHRHPRRDCVYAEAAASLGSESQGGKYDGLGIPEQMGHYRAEGHPEHGGLYACGTIVWDTTDLKARTLGEQWLAECERWTVQDQLSFPVVCRQLGITPGVFPLSQLERRYRGPDYLGNRWLRIWPHLK